MGSSADEPEAERPDETTGPEPAPSDGGAAPAGPRGAWWRGHRLRALNRPRRGARRSSPRGWWLRVVGLLGALAIASAAWILTRPAMLQSLLQPALSKALGGEVVLDDVHLEGLTTLSVRSMVLVAPGWSGPAAEVLRAEGVRVTVGFAALLTGSVDVRSLQFDRIRVRCAERENTPGAFNILALEAERRDDADHLHPVRVDLGRLDIETGTVSADGAWHQVGERSLRGFLSPSPERGDGTLFTFRLADVVDDAADGDRPQELAITGTWDERTFAVAAALDSIALDDRVLALLPLGAQRSARALGLSGTIRGAQVAWSPTAPLHAELSVGDMIVTLPQGIDLDDDWSRFRNGKREPREGLPTIHVRDGVVRLDGSRISLQKLIGELASTAGPGDAVRSDGPPPRPAAGDSAPAPAQTPAPTPAQPPAIDPLPGVVPVPIELSLDLSLAELPISAVDWNDPEARTRWLADTLRVAPFTLSVAIKGFDSSKATAGNDPVLEVPSPIASALETFGVTAWRLDVEATFSRGAPTPPLDGAASPALLPAPIRSKGQCFLSGGRGSYEAFPYEISDVRAHIAFDQDEEGADRLIVDYVSGTTEAGSTVTMKGTVARLGPDAAADITVTAPSFTIDQRLIDLFERGKHTSIACLFHQPSIDGLERAGLIPHDDEEEIRTRLAALEASLATTTDPEGRDHLTGEIARAKRMLDVRPFAMGGTGALSVRLVRTPGENPPISITGSVAIERAGVLIDEFPYPLVVTSGTISIAPQGITFGDEGLRAVTMEGGLVRIGGSIAIVQRERLPGTTSSDSVRGRPALTITGAGDRITPLLLAAIPPDRGESAPGWPGGGLARTARLLDATGLRGTIDLHGEVREEDPPPGVPAGRRMPVHTTLLIEVTNGQLDSKPATNVPQSLPAGISLRDLGATVRIDRDLVEFLSLKAVDASGQGTVTGSGSFNTADESQSVELLLEHMPIAPWLAEAMPDEAVERSRRWWASWQPSGFFDARVSVSSAAPATPGGESGTLTTIEARPRSVTVRPFGREVAVRGLDGSIAIVADEHGTHASLQGLRLTDGPDADAGSLVLDGSLEAAGDVVRYLDLDARAERLRFESPLIDLLLRWAGATEFAEAVDARHPAGRTDGTLSLRTTAGEPTTWSLDVQPQSLALDLTSGTLAARPAITFDPGGRFAIDADGARFEGLAGALDGGRVALDATVDLRAAPHVARGTYSLVGERWTDAVSALLPPPLNIARDRVALKAGRLDLDHASIELRWDPDRGLGDPLLYTLGGRVGLGSSEMTLGIPFTELDGAVDVDFRYEPAPTAGERERIALTAAIHAPTCRIYDRLLTDGTATITLAPPTDFGSQRLLIKDIGGTLSGGTLVGEASVDPASKRYAADFRVISASLAPLLSPREPEKASGGVVDARLAIEGSTLDDDRTPATRRTGRGRILIRDASMATSPITMRLLQLSQLALPLSSDLKTGDIQFFIDGPTATFDRFELTTDGLILDGGGTMDTRDFGIDLVFRSRGRLGIVSDIVRRVSDQLYEISVTGSLKDPVASIRALPGLLGGDRPSAPKEPPKDAAPPKDGASAPARS